MIKLIKAGVFDSFHEFKNLSVTPERELTYYEVELIISGNGETILNGKSYPHKKGNLIFARPGDIRHSKNRFTCFYVHLSTDDETAEEMKNVSSVTSVIDYTALKLCYTDIIRLYESGENRALMLQSKLYELFDMILREQDINKRIDGKTNGIFPDIIRSSVDFINNNYHRSITLKDIANSVNFSPIYYHNMFTSYVGKTPHAFLLEKRLESAKLYLLTTNMPMNDIVEKCGFSSHSYFDSLFKKAFGITPTEFRNQKYSL